MKKNTYGDQELIKWLNKDIKIFPAIVDLEKQFQNWFFFQEVLLKSGYPLKEILINKFDAISTQKNQKIVKKHVISLIGLEPKVEKGQSLVEEYLRSIKGIATPIPTHTLLLKTRKETQNVLGELTKTLAISDKKQVHSLFNNHEQKFIDSLPKRAQNVENTLQRFRDEKIIHEINCVQLKQKEEQKEREWLQSLRQMELEKIRANHEFIKEQDKRIYQFWWNTEKVKHDRMSKEGNFNLMMTNRMKDKIQMARNQDAEDMHENIHQFLQTCIRQGIEIEKDPTKKPIQEKAKFSAVSTMMKIRERTKHNEEARRAKTKRNNKMMVEQKRQQDEVEAKKRMDNLLDKYLEFGKQSNQDASVRLHIMRRGELQFQERKGRSLQMEGEREQFFDQLRQEAKDREKDVRKQAQIEWRIKQLEYMEQNYQKKIEKREEHILQMQPLILSLLDLTDKCYLSMQSESGKSLQLDNKLWKQLIEQWSSEVSQVKQNTDKIIAQITEEFLQYYHGIEDWEPYDTIELQINTYLGQYLFDIIDHLFPMEPIKEGLNYLFPIKVSVIGGKFSGRRVTAKYLQMKYGVDIIDIQAIMQEALKLACPPPEDPKKKNQQQTQQLESIDNPELKAFGLEINELGDKSITDELLLKGILIKMKQLYQVRTPAIVYQEMQDALAAQKLKEQQQAVEEPPPKKVSKKAPKKEVPQQGPSLEDLIKEFTNSKSFYYTKGWVMVGFPETAQQAQMLEEALTGYVDLAKRLNPEAEERKKKVSELLEFSTEQESTKILTSGTDAIIVLDTPLEQRVSRMNNRRIDPADTNAYIKQLQQYKIDGIYNLEENPPPANIKIDKLLKLEFETEEKLNAEYETFYRALPDLEQYCDAFGMTDQFKLLQRVEVIGKGIDVAKRVDQVVEQVLRINKEQFQAFFEDEERRLLTEQNNDAQNELAPAQDQEQEGVNTAQESERVNTAQGQERVNTAQGQERANTAQGSKHHRSEQSDKQVRSTTSQQGQRDEFLSEDQLKQILKQWDEISNTYVKETTIYIRRMKHQRKKCSALFYQNEKSFLELFDSGDDKQELILQFQYNFNKFLTENEDLSKQKNAKNQLNDHLQVLYEQLWDILNERKNQALGFLNKLKTERFALSQVQIYMQHVLMLLQTETNLLTEISHIGRPWSEHFILEPPSSQIIDGYKSPQLEVLINYYSDSLQEIVGNEESDIIKCQLDIAIKRGQLIYSKASIQIEEMIKMEDTLAQRIEEWIIQGTKERNDYCFQVVNYFKQCIEDRAISLLNIPEPKTISEVYYSQQQQQELKQQSSILE